MNFKNLSGWLAGILASLAIWFGLSQVPSNQALLKAVAPTQNEDGSVLTDLSSVRVYRKLNAGVYSVLVTNPYDVEGGNWSYTDPNLTTGTWCYKVTAIRATGAESPFSNESCKVIDIRASKAPTNLTVE